MRYITAAELAERWGISRSQVYNLVHVGLPSILIERSRLDPVAADAWLAERQDAA